MSQPNIKTLKETLCAQQQLLQKLYNELDVEREASSTAASEALSMILRLQGEKAAVKLEAEQYKRLAEEKMCYAEESMANFEELIYQKEMEIAALDYQVQAYRYKLMSMGCIDPGGGDIRFPENLLQRNENLVGDVERGIGRRNSLPPIPLKFSHQKRSASPDIDTIPTKTAEEQMGQNMEMENKPNDTGIVGINSYWEEIRKLDEMVKEIAGVEFHNLRNGSRSPSLISQASTSNGMRNEFVQVKKPQNSFSAILDVFEVPQTIENHHVCEQKKKIERAVDTESQGEVRQSNGVSEIIVVEGEEGRRNNNDEELKLLNEIQGQLNEIQFEIRSLKTKKRPAPVDELSLVSLTEAMLHFWL